MLDGKMVAGAGALVLALGCGEETGRGSGVGYTGVVTGASGGTGGADDGAGTGDDGSGDDGDGGDGDGSSNGFPDDGGDNPADEGGGPPNQDCGGEEFTFNATPPNLLILLDRSGSMDGGVAGTNDNRWEVATSAIQVVTNAFNDEIRFGLALYSSCDPGGCSAGQIVVPIADNNAAAIQGFINTTVGAGSLDGATVGLGGKTMILCNSGLPETSTGVSLQALVGNPLLQDPTRSNAVLLLTDGGESSECTDFINGPGGAAQLFLQNIPVRTFAVGMGGASVGQLSQIAIAGGTVEPYFADQPGDLQNALEDIAATVAVCTFTLDQVPEDLAEMYVFFDGDPAGVPHNGTDGWTYDAATNTITFHGAACDSIEDGTTAEISINYGCNLPPEG